MRYERRSVDAACPVGELRKAVITTGNKGSETERERERERL